MIARRGFIAGLAGLLATPAIVRANALMPVKRVEWYGRSPAMQALPAIRDLRMAKDMAFLEAMSQTIADVLWYGNGDFKPIAFESFYRMDLLPS